MVNSITNTISPLTSLRTMDNSIRKTQKLQTNEARDAMQGVLNQLIAKNGDKELGAKAAKLFAAYTEQQTSNFDKINAAQETCRMECTEKQQRRTKNFEEKTQKTREKNTEEKKSNSNMPVFNVKDSKDEEDNKEDNKDNEFPESLNAAHQILAELYYQAGLLSSP